jgi:hypothetical protein
LGRKGSRSARPAKSKTPPAEPGTLHARPWRPNAARKIRTTTRPTARRVPANLPSFAVRFTIALEDPMSSLLIGLIVLIF